MENTIVLHQNGNVILGPTVLKTALSIDGPFFAKDVFDLIIQQGEKTYTGGVSINVKAIKKYLDQFSSPEGMGLPLIRLAADLYERRR